MIKFCLNPQAFIPWIHLVLRCSFSWLKLQHISEHPYFCDVILLQNIHHRNTGAHHYVPWGLVRHHTLITVLEATTLCPLISSWQDAFHKHEYLDTLHRLSVNVSLDYAIHQMLIYIHTSNCHRCSTAEMSLVLS